jgi:hypothetical protein
VFGEKVAKEFWVDYLEVNQLVGRLDEIGRRDGKAVITM